MIKKKQTMKIVLLTVFILLTSLSVVSATDNLNDTTNTNDIISHDNKNISSYETVNTKVNDKNNNDLNLDNQPIKTSTKNNTKNNTNKLGTTEVTVNGYSSLVEAIETAKQSNDNNYVIKLSRGDYNATQSITWGDGTGSLRNLTIEGNNITLDGRQTYIFMKICYGYNLVLYNITLTNYACYAEDYGVIFVENGASLDVTNSHFINNYAFQGSICSFSDYAKFNVIGNTFINNNVNGKYAAVVSIGQNSHDFSISNNFFINNSVKGMHAAVVSIGQNSHDFSISNNSFINNAANDDNYVGTVNIAQWSYNFNISYNSFINNANNDDNYVGTVNIDQLSYDFNISYNTFVNNSDGGNKYSGLICIWQFSKNFSISDNTFIDNNVYLGRIISFSQYVNNWSVSNNNFTNNTPAYFENVGNNIKLIRTDDYIPTDANVVINNSITTIMSDSIIRNVLQNGENNLILNISDNDSFQGNVYSVSFFVNLTEVNITDVTDVSGVIDESIVVNVTVKTVDGYNVKNGTITIYNSTGDVISKGTVVDGVANITVTFTQEYDGTLSVNYTDEDGFYDSAFKTFFAKITSKDVANLTTTDVSVEYGSKIVISAELKSGDKAIEGKNLTLVISNEGNDIILSDLTDSNGRVEFIDTTVLPVKDSGYSFRINLTDNSYTANDTIGTLTITQVETITLVNNVTTTILNDKFNITATIINKNEDGIKINEGVVNFTINGTNYTVNVVNGIATLTINHTMLSGEYPINVVYNGTDNIAGSEYNDAVLTVNALQPVIGVENISGVTNENIIINTSIKDTNEDKVNVGTIKVYDSNNNLISSANVIDGVAQIPVVFSQFYNDTLTLVFDATNGYLSANTTINAYIKTNTSIIKIDDVKVGFGSNATVIALLVTDDSIIIRDATLSLVNGEDVVVSGKTVNGIIVFNYTANVSVGNYTYTIVFGGNDTYATSSTSVSIEVTPAISSVSVDDVNVKVSDNTTITANVINSLDPSIIINEGKVRFTINESLTSEVDVVDGLAQYNITDGLPAGTYNVTVEYLGTSNITTSNTSANVVVDKRDVQIIVESDLINPKVGDKNKLHIIVSSDDAIVGGKVNLTVNGITVTLDVTNGTVDYSYDVTSAGNESIVVSFIGDDTYNTNSSIVELEVAKAVTNVTVQTVSTTLNTTVLLNASVTSENSNVSEGTVTFYVNDTLVGTVSVANNEATTQYIAGSIGNNTIKAVYSGSDNYNASENVNTLVVTKVTPTLTIRPVQSIVGENTTIKVYVFASGLTVNDGVVTITAGSVLNATANVTDGVANITTRINNIYNGTLNVKYSNSTLFNDASSNTTLLVTKASTTITAKDITGKVNTQTTLNVDVTSNGVVSSGNITVYDVNGNLLATKTVTDGISNIILGNTTFNSTYNSVLIVNYVGNDNFESSVTVVNANISRLNATINTVRATTANVGSNINISVNIVDENKNNVTMGYVEFVYNNTVLGTVNVARGNASIVTKFTNTNNSLRINYYGEDKYTNTNKTVTVNATRLNSTVRVGVIKARIGDNITLTANVTDSAGNKVNYGTVYFRINGTNIKYANGTNVTAPVINGVAATLFTVPSTWNGNTSKFGAYYLSSVANTSSSISANSTFNVTARPVNVTFFTDSNSYYTGDKINVRVVITDNGVLVNGGTVTFKFNGVTLKYANGSNVQVAVKDGVASISYTLPANIGAGNHTFNIVFGGGIYQRYEATTKISVLKTDVHVEVSPIIATAKTTTISARVYDGHNKAVTGTTRVSIKIAGVTFVSNANITNGVISFTVNTNFATGLYDVSISVGENSYYKGTKIDTKLLKT